MKEMFIFVAIVGLVFASCKKEELVTTESAKSGISKPTDNWVRTSKKTVEFEGANYNEYSNSVSGQKVYEEVSEDNSKAPSYDKNAVWTWIETSPNTGFWRLDCLNEGNNCKNRVTIGVGGSVLVEPFTKPGVVNPN